MKKLALFFASALFFAACANEQLQPEAVVVSVEATAESLVEGTKANVSDAGAFTWQTGDVISAYKTDGTKLNSSPLGVGGSVTANFEFATGWNSTDYPTAYYPSDVTYASDNVTVPATRAWVADNTAPTMRAEYSGAYNFKHLGGVVRVQIVNVPTDARKFVFKTPGYKINGEFALVENAGVYSIATVASADEAEQTFTLTFDAPAAGTTMNFYVPVPVGTYANGFSISLLNGSDEAIYAKTGASSQSVALRQLILMSPITLAGGVGDDATTILNAGANYSGNFELPNTTNDVLIKFGPSTGTVNLVYSGSNHPANIEIQVDGTLAKLTGNLPSSHVEFTTGTIEDATLLTSATTFVVVHPAKISKSLTIAGGNAEIKGHVRSIVVAENATGNNDSTNPEPVSIKIEAPAPSAPEEEQYDAVGTITVNSDTEIDNNTEEPVNVVKGNDDPNVDVTVPDGDNAITPVEGVVAIGDAKFETIEAAIAASQAGETIIILEDLTSSAIILVDKAITIDGNDKTLTSTATRAINVNVNGEVTVKNLTIIASGERGFNVIQKPATLNINNVTATAANYTVNVAGSAGAAKVNIDNSTLTGKNVVNVAGPGTKVSVQNSTINCNDDNTTAGEWYAGLCINKDGIGASIIATNTTINVTVGSDSEKGRNDAEDGVVTINGSTDEVSISVARIDAGDYYHAFSSLAKAIEFAKAGQTVTILRDITLDAPITINADKSLTLDLNGKTISQEKDCTGSYSMITNNGKLTIKGNGTISFKDLSNGGGDTWGSYVITNNGTLVVENGTLKHYGSADGDHDTNLPIQNYKGKVTINGGTISSVDFRSLRDFTAGGEIIINGGKFEGQVWMQGLGTGSSSLTINGGEFEPVSGYDGSSVYITNGTNIVNVSITGGTFNTKIGSANPSKDGVKGCITGGTFTQFAKENTNAELLNEGYEFAAGGDGNYTVVAK